MMLLNKRKNSPKKMPGTLTQIKICRKGYFHKKDGARLAKRSGIDPQCYRPFRQGMEGCYDRFSFSMIYDEGKILPRTIQPEGF